MYTILYPEIPEILVSKKNLNEIEFPMTFRICAFELNDTVSRYQSFGYAHYGDYFRGRSMFNRATKIRGPEKLTHWEAQSPQKNKL